MRGARRNSSLGSFGCALLAVPVAESTRRIVAISPKPGSSTRRDQLVRKFSTPRLRVIPGQTRTFKTGTRPHGAKAAYDRALEVYQQLIRENPAD